MTGEELNRKYHELKGWPKRSGELLACPPLHLDANLAIAEANRVLDVNKHYWELKFASPSCSIALIENKSGKIVLHAQGETVGEAILKALIAAGGK